MRDDLVDRIQYDPVTGVFTWVVPPLRGAMKPGDIAGWRNSKGYIVIGKVRAHRLAWRIMTGVWPASEIDHANNNPVDNRWCNLRLATGSQNQANRSRQSNNTSGFKGVSLDKRRGRWYAYINKNGKRVHLGAFAAPEKAHAAYLIAADRLYGEFARAA